MTTSSLNEHHESNCKVMPPLLSTSGHQLLNLRGSWPPVWKMGVPKITFGHWAVFCFSTRTKQFTNTFDKCFGHFENTFWWQELPVNFVVFLVKELFLFWSKSCLCFWSKSLCVFGQRVVWVSEALPSTMQWMQGLCIESSWFCLMPSSPMDG